MTLSWMFFGFLRIFNNLILYKIDDTTNTVHQVEVKIKFGNKWVIKPINWFGNSYITLYVKKTKFTINYKKNFSVLLVVRLLTKNTVNSYLKMKNYRFL